MNKQKIIAVQILPVNRCAVMTDMGVEKVLYIKFITYEDGTSSHMPFFEWMFDADEFDGYGYKLENSSPVDHSPLIFNSTTFNHMIGMVNNYWGKGEASEVNESIEEFAKKVESDFKEAGIEISRTPEQEYIGNL